MKKNSLLAILFFTVCLTVGQMKEENKVGVLFSEREFWLQEMEKMAKPTLYNLAHDSLRIVMPTETTDKVTHKAHRISVQYLEVLGRVLCGIAPWLQLEGGSEYEVKLRQQYREWTIRGLGNALDSTANDFIRFDLGGQQLVDASFLALAVVRAPWIWENLSVDSQKRLVASIKTTRRFRPGFNNWLVFSAVNEAFLAKFDGDWDVMRVDYALRQLDQWYVGDGMYMDGSHYAYDYYNSYVIHPYLAAIADVIGEKSRAYRELFEKIRKRNERYAIIQERLINTDGTYPPSGRSVIYRGAAFHHLADMASKGRLPEELKPAQVRGALTAVLRKTTESPFTYENGWLTIGVYGEQWGLGDSYNNQGSPYLCTTILLPLGLPDTDEFWAGAPVPWSAQLVWGGSQEAKKDQSVHLK